LCALSHGTQRAEKKIMWLLKRILICVWLVSMGAPASAQVLVANDDAFAIPYGLSLEVEAFGVLENDELDGETAGESGATAQIVSDVSHGTLAFASDGSFTYTIGSNFDGSDSFVYRASASGAAPVDATVRLTACEGGPEIFTCWNETAFLAKAAVFGQPSFTEGFEDDAVWGVARSPITAPGITSQGIAWRANDFDPTHVDPPAPSPPPPNHITTGPGPARTGQWGLFDRGHGYAWGSLATCDVEVPPAHCHLHDGYTLAPSVGAGPLFGAGGYFTGGGVPNVGIVLDGDYLNPIGGGFAGGYQFFGVLTSNPLGFAEVQFRELDGKTEQLRLLFSDDFTILAEPPPQSVPGLSLPAAGGLAVLLLAAGAGRLRRSRSATR
jgi:hypothetical protein